MRGNKAVLFELQTPRGKLRMGVVLRGSFAQDALTFVDSLCGFFGLPPAEWEEAGYGLAWSYRDEARGVQAMARVTPWGLGEEA
jgi:hypothetical protein